MLETLLHVDFTRERVDIHASPAQNVDAMVSVQYRAIGPCLQAIPLPGYKRLSQDVGGNALNLGKLARIERGVRVERLQRRIFARVRHVVTAANHLRAS